MIATENAEIRGITAAAPGKRSNVVDLETGSLRTPSPPGLELALMSGTLENALPDGRGDIPRRSRGLRGLPAGCVFTLFTALELSLGILLFERDLKSRLKDLRSWLCGLSTPSTSASRSSLALKASSAENLKL